MCFTFDERGDLFQLAQLELLQGVYPDAGMAETKSSLYERFAPDDEDWVEARLRLYGLMDQSGGITASVGDQLLAELDIFSNAQMSTTIAGLDTDLFVGGAGIWWSPSARWFHSGPDVVSQVVIVEGNQGFRDGLFSLEQFSIVAPHLLAYGAEGLAAFYLCVAQRA